VRASLRRLLSERTLSLHTLHLLFSHLSEKEEFSLAHCCSLSLTLWEAEEYSLFSLLLSPHWFSHRRKRKYRRRKEGLSLLWEKILTLTGRALILLFSTTRIYSTTAVLSLSLLASLSLSTLWKRSSPLSLSWKRGRKRGQEEKTEEGLSLSQEGRDKYIMINTICNI